MFPLVFLYCSSINLIITTASFSKEIAANSPGPAISDVIARNFSVSTFFDRDEISIRVPDIKFEDKKKIKPKKSPKRTIQKIIKRKKKQKKRFMSPTSQTTRAPEKAREDPNYREEDDPTTKTNTRQNKQRKKQDKKWRNLLAPIYPSKARRKQRNVHIRTFERKSDKKKYNIYKIRPKREVERQLFILKNLDETEIYDIKNPSEVMVKAHVKKYW